MLPLRELLYGLIARQLNFVGQQRFQSAIRHCEEDENADLSQYFAKQKCLTFAQICTLTELTEEAIEAHGYDIGKALNSFGFRGDFLSPRNLDAIPPEDATEDTVDLTDLFELGPEIENTFSISSEREGRYEHIREHDRGGMGRIILVHDRELNRKIALKEYFPFRGGPASAESSALAPSKLRFIREAQMTARLEHPSIPPVYEIGRRLNGNLYYTMKFIRGQTLRAALDCCRTLDDRLAHLPTFLGVCNAVAYAHSKGIIHRDLKPSNVMIGDFGESVVIDWGLACEKLSTSASEGRGESGPDADIETPAPDPQSNQGGRMGTPAYMSPEQLRGEDDAIDQPSDVYALGVILHEILIGELPVACEDSDQPARSSSRRRARAESPPEELLTICTKALETQPHQRFQSAKEMAREVERFLSGALVKSHSYSMVGAASRWIRHHRTLVSVSAASLIFSACVVALFLTRETGFRSSVDEAESNAEYEKYITHLRTARDHLDSHEYDAARDLLGRTSQDFRGYEWDYLFAKTNQASHTLRDPQSSIVSASYMDDSDGIVLGLDDGRVLTYDSLTMRSTLETSFDPSPVIAVAATSSSGYLLVGQKNGTARFLDMKARITRDLVPQGFRTIYSVDVDPNWERSVITTDAGEIRIVGLTDSSGDSVSILQGTPYRARFAAAGKRVLVQTRTGRAYLLDGRTGETLSEFEGSNATVCETRNWLATIADRKITVRDMDKGDFLFSLDLPPGTAYALAIHPAGGLIAAGMARGEIVVWDTLTRSVLWEVVDDLPVKRLVFTPDGSRLISSSPEDGKISVWSLGRDHHRYIYHGHNPARMAITSLKLRSDGNEILTTSGDGSAMMWSPIEGAFEEEIKFPGTRPVYIGISPEGSSVASIDERGHIELISANSPPVKFSGLLSVVAKRADIGISAKGELCSAVSGSSLLSIVRSDAGYSPVVQDLGLGPLSVVSVSSSGDLVGVGTKDGTLIVLTSMNDILTERRGLFSTKLKSLTFSPDERSLLATSLDGGACIVPLYDATGEMRLEGHVGPALSGAFNGEGTLVATGGADNAIFLWRTDDGRNVGCLLGHGHMVSAVAFEPGSRRLLSGSYDGTVRAWDLDSNRELVTLETFDQPVTELAVSRESGETVVGFEDGTVRLFRIGSSPSF